MRDLRIQRWADVLVNYSLVAKPGHKALIVGDTDALPLIEACYEAFLKAGAFPEVMVKPGSWSEIFFTKASEDLIKTTPPILEFAAKNIDLYLKIGAESNSKLLSNIDPKKQTLASKANTPILEAILGRAAKQQMRWAYTHFPTPAAAQDAEMGTREYEEFIFDLGMLNHDNPAQKWKEVEKNHQNLIDTLSTKKELRFQNKQGTDLRVNVEGMKWINCCGRINFPDGEVYTGPNLSAKDGGVNGIAKFSFPTNYRSVEVHDIELVFEKGAVVKASASKGEKFLLEMIHQDQGSKFVGEIALGTNYHMKRITKNILFDEKFGGTFHLALGKGYPQTGNKNQSALHWDMIFDLRDGGLVTADGELISENGKFVKPKWPQEGIVNV